MPGPGGTRAGQEKIGNPGFSLPAGIRGGSCESSAGRRHQKDYVLGRHSVRMKMWTDPFACGGNITEEERMFQVSEKATEMLKEYFKDRETLPTIRIYLAPGG